MKSRIEIRWAAGILFAAVVAAPVTVPGQTLGEAMATTDALDSLNSASVGPSSGPYLDRARAAAGTANNAISSSANTFGQPGTNDGNPNPFNTAGDPNAIPAPSGYFDNNAANPFGAVDTTVGAPPNPFGANPGGAPIASAYQAPATLSAWGGERILAHGTGQVLSDARAISILATASGNYFDDGQNGNDAVAGDNIYTNITISDDYISPEAQLVKTKVIQTLEYTSALSPMNFFQVRVATTEPTSPLPKINDLQSQQDSKLNQWMTQTLRDFRINPDDKDSEFYPTFLPPPPRAPNIPLPINFTPKPIETQQFGPNGAPLAPGSNTFGGTTEGTAPATGNASGEPIGNASSRYF